MVTSRLRQHGGEAALASSGEWLFLGAGSPGGARGAGAAACPADRGGRGAGGAVPGRVGARQYPRKASASQRLTVNAFRDPLVFLRAVANSVGKQGVWAKIHALAWRKNNMEKAAESWQAILLAPGA